MRTLLLCLFSAPGRPAHTPLGQLELRSGSLHVEALSGVYADEPFPGRGTYAMLAHILHLAFRAEKGSEI